MFGRGTTREQTADSTKQCCELSRHRNRTNIRLAVFWLFVRLSSLNRKSRHPKETQNIVKMVVKRCSWGTFDTGSRSRKKTAIHSLVCVVIGMFVLGVWGITLPCGFFSGTGLLYASSHYTHPTRPRPQEYRDLAYLVTTCAYAQWEPMGTPADVEIDCIQYSSTETTGSSSVCL